MKKEYVIDGCTTPVSVQLKPQIVCVYNDEGLHCLLKDNIPLRVTQLVQHIRVDYEQLFHQSLHITNNSLIVEIWAHVYAERLTFAIARFLNWRLMWKCYKFVKKRCDIIDCGESALDSNRWAWDMLSKLKKIWLRLFNRLPETTY